MSAGDQKFDESTISGLIRRMSDYEMYFKTEDGDKLDHQGTTAYINLIKLVYSIKSEGGEAGQDDPEQMKERVRRVLKEEYGVER